MVLTPVDVPAVVRQSLSGKGRDRSGTLFAWALMLALLLSLLILAVLLWDVIADSLSVWTDRSFADFVGSQLSANPDVAGIWQAFYGSLLLMMFVIVFAVPTGVASAIYLEEYAVDNRISRTINAAIRNLAGVPSIVYGILGLAIFVKLLGEVTGPGVEGRSLVSGGLTLAVLVLPIVIITTAEALRAVPNSIREGAFGVGATRFQAIRYHVLPVAAPGIFTGTILSIARAFGEAAPLLLVGGITTFFQSGADSTFLDVLQGRFSAMPVLVFSWARLPQEGFRALTAALIVVMLVVLLLINFTAIYLRNRYEKTV
ncbi:MAG TPA: phosphate ABC transporter permease PstA [Acidimicrobiia bacterium]|nr:phosphate ABC transporter permease PstA [Acidimicrobiia bacterium]